MTADGTDIGLDNAQGDVLGCTALWRPWLVSTDNELLGASTPRQILFGDCAIQNDSFCIQPIFEVVAISAAALNIQFIGSCRDAGV